MESGTVTKTISNVFWNAIKAFKTLPQFWLSKFIIILANFTPKISLFTLKHFILIQMHRWVLVYQESIFWLLKGFFEHSTHRTTCYALNFSGPLFQSLAWIGISQYKKI